MEYQVNSICAVYWECKMVLILLRASYGLHTVLRDSNELSYLIRIAAL